MSGSAEKKTVRVAKDAEMDKRLYQEFYDQAKRKRHKRNVRIGFVVTLVIVLVASLLNWGVVTGWGNTRIQRINFSGNDGAKFSGLVYRPSNATDKTPSPAILMLHGNAGNARNQEAWAVEFSRRGFTVVVPDLYGSGDSQGYFDGTPVERKSQAGASSERALIDEAQQFYEYMENLPYVDKNNIIVSGHSQGGSAACVIGAENNAKGILAVSGTPIGGPLGKNAKFNDEFEYDYQGNVAFLYGAVEGFNKPGGDSLKYTEMTNMIKARGIDEGDDQIQQDKVYGSFELGNAIVFHLDQRIHEAAFVDNETITHLVDYGQQMIGDAVPNYIPADNTVWQAKDYVGLFGIFAFAAFLCATALLLVEEIPAFSCVRRPLARNIGFRGKSLAIATAVGVVVPYIVCKTDAFGIVGGGMAYNLWRAGFNLGFANMGFGVIIGLAIVCCVGMVLFIISKRKDKLTASDFGLTPADYESLEGRGAKAKAILKTVVMTILVAAITIGIGFVYLQLQEDVLGTDFYAWFFGFKNLPVQKVPYYLPYLVVFIVCMLVLSIDMNVIRRLPSTGNETKDTIIAIAVNVAVAAAMIIVIVAVKWHLQTIGSSADTNWLWSMGLDTQRIWGMPVGMTVAAASSTFIYKKTGNLWLCAILVGTIACLMGLLYGGARFHYLTYFYN